MFLEDGRNQGWSPGAAVKDMSESAGRSYSSVYRVSQLFDGCWETMNVTWGMSGDRTLKLADDIGEEKTPKRARSNNVPPRRLSIKC